METKQSHRRHRAVEMAENSAKDAPDVDMPNAQQLQQARRQSKEEVIEEQIQGYIKAPHYLEGKKEVDWKGIAITLLDRLRNGATTPYPALNGAQELKELRQDIKGLQETVKQIGHSYVAPTKGASSWAKVAALPGQNATTTRTARVAPPMRADRELTVRVADKAEAKALSQKTPAQILKELELKEPSLRQQLASARHLPSGDILLRTNDTMVKERLEKDQTWAGSLAGTAKVLRKSYAVLVHGVRTTLDTSKQELAVKQLERDNGRLHPGLEILRVAWPKRVTGSGKAHSSLIVETTSKAMANRLLDHGLVESHQEHTCEYFEKGSRVVMCFRCYKLGHRAYTCKNKEFCHKCGGEHNAERCGVREERKHCSSCAKEGHKPWQKSCPAKAAAQKRADEIFRNRPDRFHEGCGRSVSSSGASTLVATPELSPARGSTRAQEWVEVGPKRRRTQRSQSTGAADAQPALRRNGRPRDIDRAGKRADQGRIRFTASQ